MQADFGPPDSAQGRRMLQSGSCQRQQPSDSTNKGEKKTRRKPSKMGVLPSSISKEDLAKWFHLPSEEACVKLGISLTVLKRVSRKFGIKRWPFRKVKSLSRLLTDVGAAVPAVPLPERGVAPSLAEASDSTNGTSKPSSSTAAKQQLQQRQQHRQQAELQRRQQQQWQQQAVPSGPPSPSPAGVVAEHAVRGHQQPATSGSPPLSEGCSFAPSAIDLLIAAIEAEPAQGGVLASAASPSALASAGAGSLDTLQGTTELAPMLLAATLAVGDGQGEGELEEGEIRPPAEGVLTIIGSEGCGETGCSRSCAPAGEVRLLRPPQQQQWQEEGRHGRLLPLPAAEAQAAAPLQLQPTKPVSVKHLMLAKYLAQHSPQPKPVEHAHSTPAAARASRASIKSLQIDQLQSEGSHELERLPTFDWGANKVRQPQHQPQSLGCGRHSPAFSFNLGQAAASAASARGEQLGAGGGFRARPTQATVTVASLHVPALPEAAAAAATAATLAATQPAKAAATGSSRHAGVRPPDATGQRSGRKRSALAGWAPIPPSPFKQARTAPTVGGEETISPYIPTAQLHMMGPPAAAAVTGEPQLNPYDNLVQRLRRVMLMQSAALLPGQPPLPGGSLQLQPPQQAQQALLWQEVLLQQAQRAQEQLQLSPSGSLSASQDAGGPQHVTQQAQQQAQQWQQQPQQQSGLGLDSLLREGSSAAAALQQRQQLRDALQAAVLAGKSLPPRLALWCLKRYAQRLGYALHSVNMTRLDGGASNEADSGTSRLT